MNYPLGPLCNILLGMSLPSDPACDWALENPFVLLPNLPLNVVWHSESTNEVVHRYYDTQGTCLPDACNYCLRYAKVLASVEDTVNPHFHGHIQTVSFMRFYLAV